MNNNIPPFLLTETTNKLPEKRSCRINFSFLDKSIRKIAFVIKTGFIEIETQSGNHGFHKLDARVKLLFMVVFLLVVSIKRNLESEIVIFLFIFFLVVITGLNIFRFYKRVLILGFLFGFLIALPSSLNIITDGDLIIKIASLEHERTFWIYRIPADIGFTRHGIDGVLLLTMRVINSVSISFLVLFTTRFPEIIKALKIFKIPNAFLMIIIITYKYIFIFARTIEEIYLSMKSRGAGVAPNRELRRLIAGRIGYMFRKSRFVCEEVYKAMESRGFTDEVKMLSLGRLKKSDWAVFVVLLFIGLSIIFI